MTRHVKQLLFECIDRLVGTIEPLVKDFLEKEVVQKLEHEWLFEKPETVCVWDLEDVCFVIFSQNFCNFVKICHILELPNQLYHNLPLLEVWGWNQDLDQFRHL